MTTTLTTAMVGTSSSPFLKRRTRRRGGSFRCLLATVWPWLWVCSALTHANSFGQHAPPNIVLIYADDLGYGELGCYGQEKIRTPNIDALAAQGLRFTQFYAGSAVCAPSRCVVMTGLDTGHAPIRNNAPWARQQNPFGEGQEPLPDTSVTLAEILGDVGYTTGCFGKWGLGGPGSEGAPERQGFDRFLGFHCQWQAHTFFPPHLWRTGRGVDGTDTVGGPGFERIDLSNQVRAHERMETDPADAALWIGPDYAVDRYAEAALAFIQDAAQDQTPFFVWYATAIPHVALQIPQRALAEYDGAFVETPYRGQQGYTPHPTPRAAYAAMITEFDRNVGRIVQTLRDTGTLDNTIILVTSDNGATYAGGVDATFFNSVAGLRGLKGSLFEGGLRVPLVVTWPGHTPVGEVTDHVAGQVDLLVTLGEAAGALSSGEGGLGHQGQGESFLPTLLGEGQSARARDLYWELGRQQALRHDDWKIVRIWPGPPRGQSLPVSIEPRVLLFDLASDPFEANDVSEAFPDRRDAMLERLDAARVPPEVEGFQIPGLDRASD